MVTCAERKFQVELYNPAARPSIVEGDFKVVVLGMSWAND